jgi:Tol biopolymer transport system component
MDYFKINIDVSSVYVYDITGRIVKQFKGSFGIDSEFEISSLDKGMYFVGIISNDNGTSIMKIVKQ